MRIPSQFNDSSLYRPKRGDESGSNARRQPVRTDSRRRLIRLSVALLLVIVVMRQAQRPGVYEIFFPASGQPASGQLEQPQDDAKSVPSIVLIEGAPSGEKDNLTGSVGGTSLAPWSRAAAWVENMEPADQKDWIASLMRLRRIDGASPDADTSFGSSAWKGLSTETLFRNLDELAQVPDQDPAIVDQIAADAQRFESALTGETIDEAVRWAQLSWWGEPVLDALDRAALSRVKDGTFWTGSDSDAFYLQLARAGELSGRGTAKTGTLPLLQQPDTYQGQTIRLVGKLGVAEFKQAQDNSLGVDSYWKVWMIPDDGGIRPILLIVQELPSALADCLTVDGQWNRACNPNNPEGAFSAVGRFVKRLPYRSSLGADLAPAVIGRIESTRGASRLEEKENARGSGETSSSRGQAMFSSQGWLAIASAMFAGFLIAAVLMVRTKRDAARTRELRHRANELSPSELAAIELPNTNSDERK